MKQDLTIIPVINKIDLPHANLEQVYTQLEDILAIPREEAIPASAKNGIGIEEILEAIVERVPPPKNHRSSSTQALLFDFLLRHLSRRRHACARVQWGDESESLSSCCIPERTLKSRKSELQSKALQARSAHGRGNGILHGQHQKPARYQGGDTLTDAKQPSPPLPGFQEIHPMVYSGIYPINTADYEHLKANLAKLQLNDAAFVYQQETS